MTTRQSSSKHTMPIKTLGKEFFAPMFVAFFTLFGVKLCRRREGELTATECGSEKVISEVDELKVIFN